MPGREPGPDLPEGAFVVDPVFGRVGGSRWLFVVVEYPPGGIGVVLTAFPRRRLPGHP